MAELLKRGIIAALAPRNAPGFDILATKGGKDVRIRVKTKSEEWPIWQWSAKKDGTIFLHLDQGRDFTVLVDLAEDFRNLRYYIVPTATLDVWLREDHAAYLRTPGRNGRMHSADNNKRHLHQEKHAAMITPYCDRWEMLWGEGQ